MNTLNLILNEFEPFNYNEFEPYKDFLNEICNSLDDKKIFGFTSKSQDLSILIINLTILKEYDFYNLINKLLNCFDGTKEDYFLCHILKEYLYIEINY